MIVARVDPQGHGAPGTLKATSFIEGLDLGVCREHLLMKIFVGRYHRLHQTSTNPSTLKIRLHHFGLTKTVGGRIDDPVSP